MDSDSGGRNSKELRHGLCSEGAYHPSGKIGIEQIIINGMSAKYRVLWKCVRDVPSLRNVSHTSLLFLNKTKKISGPSSRDF